MANADASPRAADFIASGRRVQRLLEERGWGGRKERKKRESLKVIVSLAEPEDG